MCIFVYVPGCLRIWAWKTWVICNLSVFKDGGCTQTQKSVDWYVLAPEVLTDVWKSVSSSLDSGASLLVDAVKKECFLLKKVKRPLRPVL